MIPAAEIRAQRRVHISGAGRIPFGVGLRIFADLRHPPGELRVRVRIVERQPFVSRGGVEVFIG